MMIKAHLKDPLKAEELRCLNAAHAVKAIECQVEAVKTASFKEDSLSQSDVKMALYYMKDAASQLRDHLPEARDLANKIATRARHLFNIVENFNGMPQKHRFFFRDQMDHLRGYNQEVWNRAIGSCGGWPSPEHKLEPLPSIPKELIKDAKKAKKENEARIARGYSRATILQQKEIKKRREAAKAKRK